MHVWYVNYIVVTTDIWGMKKSQSTSNLIRDVPQRSSSQPFVPRPSHNTVDSGYNTVTGSTGNLHSRSVGSGAPIRHRQHESNGTYSIIYVHVVSVVSLDPGACICIEHECVCIRRMIIIVCFNYMLLCIDTIIL